jgi:hypothetical protein
MAATSPVKPDVLDENSIPPPVYEVEEDLIERRISTVPVAKDRRGGRGPAPGAPESGESGNR